MDDNYLLKKRLFFCYLLVVRATLRICPREDKGYRMKERKENEKKNMTKREMGLSYDISS